MPLRLAFLSKYPPLEGGIAAKTYWLARGLASRGHEVHVITHEECAGGDYCMPVDGEWPTPGVHVHPVGADIPWHIPEDKEYALALLDRTLGVASEFGVQVIDSGYMVPYGMVGGLAKRLAGLPHVLRHGGSDVQKFLRQGVLERLLVKAAGEADAVVTDRQHASILAEFSQRISVQPPYVPDESAFCPAEDPDPRGRVAYIGKANYYWRYKRLDAIAAIMSSLVDEIDCWIVGQGKGLNDFQDSLDASLASRLSWRPFVHPCEMPGLLSGIDAVFVFESALPFQVISNLVLEALCMGVGLVTDRADFAETYRDLISPGEDHLLVVSPDSPKEAASEIRGWLASRRRLPAPRLSVAFHQYLTATESLYSHILA